MTESDCDDEDDEGEFSWPEDGAQARNNDSSSRENIGHRVDRLFPGIRGTRKVFQRSLLLFPRPQELQKLRNNFSSTSWGRV